MRSYMVQALIRPLLLSAILAITFVLAACGSSPAKREIPEEPGIVTPFSGGVLTSGFSSIGIKLTYDKNGNWDRITSTATAVIFSDTQEAGESAVTVAQMKALRQISEFVKTDITSKKVLTTISNNIRGESTGDGSEYAQKLSDSITQSSSAILRGTLVESAYVNAATSTVTVVMYADRKTLDFARKITKGIV